MSTAHPRNPTFFISQIIYFFTFCTVTLYCISGKSGSYVNISVKFEKNLGTTKKQIVKEYRWRQIIDETKTPQNSLLRMCILVIRSFVHQMVKQSRKKSRRFQLLCVRISFFCWGKCETAMCNFIRELLLLGKYQQITQKFVIILSERVFLVPHRCGSLCRM